jgi:tRNA (mo5U34)-methyltransferase
VPDISVKSVGTWDVVLFLGVLYHLKSPLTALEAIAEVASDCLIVETRVQNVNRRSPMLVYHPSDTLSGDTTNYFTPNPAFLLSVLRECGFSVFDTLVFHERLTLHGWRNTSRRKLGTAPEMHKGAVVYPAYRAAQAVKRLLTRRGR